MHVKKVQLIILLSIFTLQVSAQVNDSLLIKKIMESANKMSNAYLKSDYIGFLNYMPPQVLEKIGRQSTLNSLKETHALFEKDNFIIKSLENEKPLELFYLDSSVQTFFRQKTLISVPGGNIISYSTILALSDDNGKTWHFIDASNKTYKELIEYIPNFNPAITIPTTPTEPKFEPNKNIKN